MQVSVLKQDKIILYSGLAVLLLIVLINPLPPFFDEKIYLQDADMLRKYGFGRDFLLSLSGSAGPLYGIVHYIFEPFTQFQAPYIRLVNILFFGGVLFFLSRTLALPGFSGGNFAIYCLAIPMAYVSAGLNLTEMPAMFFLSAGLYLVLRTVISQGTRNMQYLSLMVAGICMGLAIIGRQPFLVLIAAFPIMFRDSKWTDNLLKLGILTLFSLPIPAYVFWVWQDLVAPFDAQLYNSIAADGTILRLDFFFMCLGYFALTFFIVSPGFYYLINKRVVITLLGGFITIAIINYFIKWIEFLPLGAAVRLLLPTTDSEQVITNLCGSGLMVISGYFLYTLFMRVQDSAWNRNLLFYSVMLVLIAFSCTKITWGFSSRYPGQALPLIIPVCSFFRTRNRFSSSLLALGVIIGIFSLLAYVMGGLDKV